VTFRLKTFGGPLIEGPGGPLTGAITQRRRLAALALMAAHGGHLSRDRLAVYLWPESDEERARHALAQLLYSLRRDLGEDAITGSSTMLLLNGDVLRSDVAEFEAALKSGDLERALILYSGPFLEGFYLNGCPEFERWVEDLRSQLHQRACTAAETVAASATGTGDKARAVHAWRRAAALAPYDSRVALALMRALVAAGDPAGAVQHARIHAALLQNELGSAPDPAIEAYVAALPAANPGVSEARKPVAPAAAPPPGAAPAEPVPASTVEDAAAAAAQPSRARRRRVAAWVGGSAALAATIAAALLTEADAGPRQWIVIADVENRTDDPVFDHTVPLAITTSLRQSKRVHVTTPERVEQALVRMRMAGADSLLDVRLAVELARREGIRFVLVPTVVPSADGYELTARLVDPESQAVMVARTVRASSRADVLRALDRLGRVVRRELGESLFSVSTSAVPLPRVTTASLDALKSYADGWKEFGASRWGQSELLWKQAVARDSSFASAWAALGTVCYWLNRPTEGSQHFERALDRMTSLPVRERVMIQAAAFGWRGNREASTDLLRTYLVGNPDDTDALARLGYDLLRLDRDAEAADVFLRLLAVDSMSWSTWLNLATVEKGLGRVDSAVIHYRRAFALAPWAETGNDNLNHEYGSTYLLAGDTAAAAAVFAKMLPLERNLRARGLRSMAYLALLRGEYRDAADQLAEAAAINRFAGAPLSEVRNRLLLAATYEQLGDSERTRAELDSAYAVGRRIDLEPTVFFWLGKALARAHSTRAAVQLLDSLGTRVRPDARSHRAALEGLRGEVLVAQGDAAGAVPHLEAMIRADSSAYTLESLAFGVAAAGDLDRAAQLYRELDRPAVFGFESQQYSRLAPYWLGRIEERRGDAIAAIRAFEAFVAAFSRADPDLVPLVDARVRLDRLRLSDRPR